MTEPERQGAAAEAGSSPTGDPESCEPRTPGASHDVGATTPGGSGDGVPMGDVMPETAKGSGKLSNEVAGELNDDGLSKDDVGLVLGTQPGADAVKSLSGARTAPNVPRLLLLLVGMGMGWITLQGLREIQSLLAPTLLAVTLVVTVYPLVPYLTRHGVPRLVAALAAMLTVYSVLAGLLYSVYFCAAQLVETMPQYQGRFEQLWTETEAALTRWGVSDETTNWSFESLGEYIDPERILSYGSGILSSLAGVSSLAMLVLLVTMFVAMDTASMPERMRLLKRTKPNLASGFDHFAKGVRSYWVVSTVFGLIVAVLDYIALLILGVPLALTWALFSFVTNYIPNVGLVIGMVPPALLALFSGGVYTMLWVIVAYIALNTVVQTFIQPKFVGDAVGITATASFLSLILWAYVLGPLGALLAVPMTLMVKTLLVDLDPAAGWVNAFLASDPSHSPLQQNTVALPGEAAVGKPPPETAV